LKSNIIIDYNVTGFEDILDFDYYDWFEKSFLSYVDISAPLASSFVDFKDLARVRLADFIVFYPDN